MAANGTHMYACSNAYGHKTNPSNKCSPYTHKKVSHIFRTNFGKYTNTCVTLLGRGSIYSQESCSHFWNKSFKKPTYFKTLSVIVSSAAYELSRSASYEIVGHIFGTNLGKTDILQDSFGFCHTHRLCSFLMVTVEPWTQNKLLQRMLSHTSDSRAMIPTLRTSYAKLPPSRTIHNGWQYRQKQVMYNHT